MNQLFDKIKLQAQIRVLIDRYNYSESHVVDLVRREFELARSKEAALARIKNSDWDLAD